MKKLLIYLLGILGTVSMIGLIGIALYSLKELFCER